MIVRILAFYFVLFSVTSFARLDWPHRNQEGRFCGIGYTEDAFYCPEGLGCDLRLFALYGHGICRRLCQENSQCLPEQKCDFIENKKGFCLSLMTLK